MKILSLDLSTRSSGYAVWVNGKLKEYGTIKNSSEDFLERGNYMAENVRLLVLKHGKFDKVVVEELKVITNQKVLVMLGIVNGLVLRELSDTEVTFVPPTAWRKTFHLNGKRSDAKRKAIAFVKGKGIDVKNDDEAEAILIGKYYIKTLDNK